MASTSNQVMRVVAGGGPAMQTSLKEERLKIEHTGSPSDKSRRTQRKN